MFLALKLLRVGAKQAKKHSAKNKTKQTTQSPWPENPYYNQGPQPYPNHPYYGNPNGGSLASSTTHSSTPITQPYIPPNGSPQGTSKMDKIKTHLESLLRLVQFALGLAVIGLYGQDVKPSGSESDSRWVYAVVVGFLASVTTFSYLVLNLVVMKNRPLRDRPGVRLPVFVWEAVLVVNWLVVFGIFAKLFLGNGDGDGMGVRMRRAVYVDLVGLALWVGSAGWMGERWWKGRVVGGGDVGGEKGVEM